MNTLKVNISKNSKYGILYDTPPSIRYILLYGGRATGRSFQASRADVINLCVKPYYRGFIMRNILDQVRDSIFQDCVDRINDYNLPVQVTDLMLKNGDKQLKGRGFKKSSGNDTAKNKSVAGINHITIEEAEEVDFDDFTQMDLSLRTVKEPVTITLLFNPPVKGHWILSEWFNLIPSTKENAIKHFGKCWFEDVSPESLDGFYLPIPKNREDTHYIFGTYLDNISNLDPNTVAKMKSLKDTNIEYYLHKICGLIPSGRTGRVLKTYSIISDQDYYKLELPTYHGLDFGFVNDPTACVEFKTHNNKLYVKELLYETGLTNPLIADKLSYLKNKKIIADSAEQKSIQELNNLGLWVVPAKKGAGSVMAGINKLNEFDVYICESSTNLQNEAQNYVYKIGKDKLPTNEPIDSQNHGIGDALRYSLQHLDTHKEEQRNVNILAGLGY
jgi:phage terminase large subunit